MTDWSEADKNNWKKKTSSDPIFDTANIKLYNDPQFTQYSTSYLR